MSKILKNIMIAIFACYLLICSLIWLISPSVSSHFLKPILAENNLNLAEKSSIRYNPFISKVSITEFELSNLDDSTHEVVFGLDSAELELSLWHLINKTLHVSQFDINGLQLKIDKTNEQLVIAGWPLSSEPAEKISEEENAESNVDDFNITIPAINVNNSAINLNWLQHEHKVDLSSINLSQLNLSTHRQNGSVALNLGLNDSPIQLDAEFDLHDLVGDISYALSVKELNLARFNHFIYPENTKSEKELTSDALASGMFSIDYQQNISLSKKSINNKFSNINLSLSDFITRQQGAHLAIAKQTVMSKELILNIDDWSLEAPKITIESMPSYELSSLNAYTSQENLSLASINRLSIPQIDLATVNEKHTVSLPEIVIENGKLSDDTNDETASLAHFKSINIVDIKLSEDGLAINHIDILGLGIDIKKTSESKIAGLIELKASDAKPKTTTDNTPEISTKSDQTNAEETVATTSSTTADTQLPVKEFTIALNELKLIDTDSINLVDESVQPPIERYFELQQLNIGPLDNQAPDQLTLLKVVGKSNKYANFKVDAESKPFSPVAYYKLNGLFKEVSLPEISTYIKDALQYEFDSGQLDLIVDVTVQDTDISGETKIMLRGLELGAANNPHDDALASSSSIPFNYALGMLKDGDGNVELDIPLKGKTTDPDFSLQGFITLLIKRATMSAAKDYLITTFVPYANIVKVSMIAGDYLLKVRFNDLPLTAGDSNIPESAAPFLDQFSTLMQEKEETELTICAFSTPQDIGITEPEAKLNEAQHKQLKALSLARMDAFKQHMVEERAISSSRLLLCSPKVDNSENAIARLTFSD